MTAVRFNVLTDPWIPLSADGAVRLVSYSDLLAGASDASDLSHPRDDFKFYARMLLSALTQALFAPKDVAELRERIARPLARDVIGARVATARADFELVGSGAFLQEAGGGTPENETGRLLLDVPSGSNHLLFRPAHSHDGMCAPCALVALYGIQAFAPSGGRGFSPGVRGAPPLTTLVWLPSLRASIWANVLSGQATTSYPAEGARPWVQRRREKAGEAIGLVEGLFWQPRSLTLATGTTTVCSACGSTTAGLLATGVAPKSKVAGGFFRHPFTPARHDRRTQAKRAWSPYHLRTDRPAWTGLADMLSWAVGKTSGEDSLPVAAPVVQQWFEHLSHHEVTLLVFAYATNKAKIEGRFAETLTLSMDHEKRDVLSEVRHLVNVAERSQSELNRALRRAHSSRREDQGGHWLPDALSAFWQGSEEPFWRALAEIQQDRDGIPGFAAGLRKLTLGLFDEHTAPSMSDNIKQQCVARARAGLARNLARILTGETANVQ